MRNYITRALYAAAAAGMALTTLGLAGAAAPATAATRSLGPPVYDLNRAGYVSSGRWFRFVSTALTVPPATLPVSDGGSMIVMLGNPRLRGAPPAIIFVRPGGGSGSVSWSTGQRLQPFAMSPKVGDRLSVSIYYDQHGHLSFTATDLTKGVTSTGRAQIGNIVYNQALLTANLDARTPAPPGDTRLWKVDGTHLTTSTGTHGTLTGPWQTSQMIQTSSGTATGTVVTSPSGLWNGGANFGIWLRALPLAYTQGFAGYTDSGNSAVTSPPADTQLWQFAGSNVTTYGGYHGSILGPWATSHEVYTTDGTRGGAVVADASSLSNGGQDFGVWLRHR